jgi:acetylcholinesterase
MIALLFAVLAALPLPLIAAPQLKLGGTTLVGRDITGLKLEFFGGASFSPPCQPLW